MEHLYVLGTGYATATHCYNTCFALRDDICDQYILVDTGGGNGILRILEDMNISFQQIHNIFITHEHTDHHLGIFWMIRVIATQMKRENYQGDLQIYCHEDLVQTILTIGKLTIQPKFFKYIGERIHIIPVHDDETVNILDYSFTFFDIHSTKAKQFGFTTTLHNGKKLTCCGDEPFNPDCHKYVDGSDWLLHEAFCLYSQRDIFKPYEKHHSTVMDAAKMAEKMQIPNLVLWHTEDKCINNRKKLYLEEGKPYYHGNLYVPDDQDIITL